MRSIGHAALGLYALGLRMPRVRVTHSIRVTRSITVTRSIRVARSIRVTRSISYAASGLQYYGLYPASGLRPALHAQQYRFVLSGSLR